MTTCMTAVLRQLHSLNRIPRGLIFGCALALAVIVSPQEGLAQPNQTIKICKQTIPSPDLTSTAFPFSWANSWPTPLPGFSLTDVDCQLFDVTNTDKFNKFAESVPPGWTLTNISCSATQTVVQIIGANTDSAFQPGDNMVTMDLTEPNVTCTFVNRRSTEPGDSTLKICKVAGPRVTVGTPFSFTAGANSTSVPAGPPPGGYCTVVGSNYTTGSSVTVTETVPPGYGVTNITCNPPGSYNLASGTATVNMDPGVTECTYTDEKRTGYLEICKTGDVTGNFSFTVNPATVDPGGSGPFVVPAGACSPALEVPAGTVTITEAPQAGTAMTTGCSTLPASQQGPCNPKAGTSTVTVAAGDISTQTIAFITNRPTDKTKDKRSKRRPRVKFGVSVGVGGSHEGKPDEPDEPCDAGVDC